MTLPDGRPLAVHEGILCEPSSEGSIILWLPGEHADGYRHWERVVATPRAAIATGQGVCSIAATSVPIRQRLGRSFVKLLRALRGSRVDRTWTIPGGKLAEQCGARRADLRLAWAEDATTPLDEVQIKSLWPGCRESRAIGPNLYFVAGVAYSARAEQPAKTEPESPGETLPQESPRALAERALGTARAAGDLRGTVTALTDLGVVLFLEGDSQRAAVALEEACAEAERLGDSALAADAASSLALAACSMGQPRRARQLLGPALARARAGGDRYAAKLVHDRLALALVGLGDQASALDHLVQAVKFARALGDGKHEAELLWRAAIACAELGDRDQATSYAVAAIDRLSRLGHPAAGWYAQHLANYQSGAAGATLPASAITGNAFGGSIDAGAAHTSAAPAAPVGGPGPLRMALTAARAMATFVGSGFKTASPASYQARLEVCAACEHHTGVRCRLCGCITTAKARMLHERCPTGRWPDGT